MVIDNRPRILKTRGRLTPEMREQLIVDHLPLVKHVLARLSATLPAHVDRDDLLEAGMLGLIDATDRFDPKRNVRFHTYALSRIRGAMLDSLRGADWLPRSVRSELARINEAREQIEQQCGRQPTMSEVTRSLGLRDRKAARLARASTNCVFHSLDELPHGTLEDENEALHSRQDSFSQPLDRAVLEEEKERLAAAVGRLPKTERLVISLYYFEQMPLREIAGILRVTDSRVCQIHRIALKRLHGVLAERESVALASA